ncbi:MAG: ABC transporter ATP-binding protein [Rhodospirillales bacterium]|nr:ABC transporter ATP-binding protein [Rhodospirillales bacterium]MDE2199638.1 ABC transporter ATP-binding protein [Rhodospirillales bacterium]MDE2574489.1 ABC transporter ATP-binding protein [Rhodospirillales bacterium]
MPDASAPGTDNPGAALLCVEGLCAGYSARAPIVHDLSLALRAGEIVALLGTNGAGKSTAMKAMACAIAPFAGRIVCAGTDLTGAPSWVAARAGMGYVPQRDNVFAQLTVQENFAVGARARNGRDGPDTDAVLALFPDLKPRLASRAGVLSGGMRQMVAIGRALLGAPRVLLLDEPSAGLSPLLVGRLFARLTSLRQHLPILLVEQNVRAALAIADRALVMVEGRLHLATEPDDPAVTAVLAGGLAV